MRKKQNENSTRRVLNGGRLRTEQKQNHLEKNVNYENRAEGKQNETEVRTKI